MDYKERMKEEYWQLKGREEKLEAMLRKEALGQLDFKLTCPVRLLNMQLHHMKKYREVLEARAELEGVDFGDYNREGR